MESKLQFHSHLTLMAQVLVPCWIQFYLPSWKKRSSDVWVVLYQLHHHCFYAYFQTSWAWNKDTVLLYSIWYCTVKYTKAQPLVEDSCTWQCTPDTWTNLRDWTCELTFTSLKVHNLKVRMEGTYCTGNWSFHFWSYILMHKSIQFWWIPIYLFFSLVTCI